MRPARCLDVIESAAGSSTQRNAGLARVASPVVFFPDDDALWFPGFSSAVMRIYERDTDGLIGGVGGDESPFPPTRRARRPSRLPTVWSCGTGSS